MASEELLVDVLHKWLDSESESVEMLAKRISTINDAAIREAVIVERDACELIALRKRDSHRGPQGQAMSLMQRNIDMAEAANCIAKAIRARTTPLVCDVDGMGT